MVNTYREAKYPVLNCAHRVRKPLHKTMVQTWASKNFNDFQLYWCMVFEDHETVSLIEKGSGIKSSLIIYRAGDLATAYLGATMPTHWTLNIGNKFLQTLIIWRATM